MVKPSLERKVDLLIETLGQLIEATHRHNEAFRDALANLADVIHAKDAALTSLVGKLVALQQSRAQTLEDMLNGIADDVTTFDANLHTMNANAEQRFNAMHLEHDLIIDMLSRPSGNREQPKD